MSNNSNKHLAAQEADNIKFEAFAKDIIRRLHVKTGETQDDIMIFYQELSDSKCDSETKDSLNKVVKAAEAAAQAAQEADDAYDNLVQIISESLPGFTMI
jgi:hypothetical protein